MAVIETDGLSKLYGSQRGIEDVTIAVEAGEVAGVLVAMYVIDLVLALIGGWLFDRRDISA